MERLQTQRMYEVDIIHNSDCIEGMRTLPDNIAQLAIIDPPYFKIVNQSWDHAWNTQEQYLDWCMEWTHEAFRLLNPGGQMYVWGGIGKHKEHPFLRYLFRVEEETEFVFQNFITMKNFRVFGNSKHFPFGRQELLVFIKPGTHVYHKQYSDFEGVNRLGNPKLVTNVWVDCKDVSLYNQQDSHPTQKPYKTSERIILSSSNPDDIVLVPFVGSGVDCSAAKLNGRRYVGFETNQAYYQNAISNTEAGRFV